MKNKHVWSAFSAMGHPLYADTEVIFERGEGVYLYDTNNKKYFDGYGTLWTNIVGHGRMDVIEPMYEQMKKLSFMSQFCGSHNVPALELADMLIENSPFDHDRCFYGCSGSDAVDTAIKLARGYWHFKGQPEKKMIISRKSEYHGVTLGATGVMGFKEYREPFAPLVPGLVSVSEPDCYRCSWGKEPETCDVDCKTAFDEAFEKYDAKNRVAAILIEPFITSGGLIPTPPGYWDHVQKLCRENDVLIIVDEASTGMGRTGTLYASEQYGLDADICLLAKSLTSGYAALSVAMVKKEIFDVYNQESRYFAHGSTFSGHPASCVAAKRIFEIIEEEGLCERANVIEKTMTELCHEHLENLEHVGCIRGKGVFSRLELVSDKAAKSLPPRPVDLALALYRELLNRGQYLKVVGRFVNMAPSQQSTPEQLEQMVLAVRDAISEVSKNVDLWR